MGCMNWPTPHSSRIKWDESGPSSIPPPHPPSVCRQQGKGNVTHLSNMRHSSETSREWMLNEERPVSARGGMEQDWEGQSQPAEVEENSSLSFTYDFFEVCSSSSAECVLGCILGFSESHSQKSPQEEKFRTIYQVIKWAKFFRCVVKWKLQSV